MIRIIFLTLLFSLLLSSPGHAQYGRASWYKESRYTASGEHFNSEAMTAAHRTLPFGTRLLVTDPKTGASVVVRINDRGPYIHGRVLDLTRGAAKALGILQRGVIIVRYQVL